MHQLNQTTMNKLQIIQEILGDKFTPIVSCSNVEFYYAKPKNGTWVSSYSLNDIINKAKSYNVRIAVDLYYGQFDFFFNN